MYLQESSMERYIHDICLQCKEYTHPKDIRVFSFNAKTPFSFPDEQETFGLGFLTEGSLMLKMDKEKVMCNAQEMFLIVRHMGFALRQLSSDYHLVCIFFKSSNHSCKLFYENSLQKYSHVTYHFGTFKMNRQMKNYIRFLDSVISPGPHCRITYERYLFPIYSILNEYYGQEKICRLLNPIMGTNLEFRQKVLQTYQFNVSVADLARETGHGLTAFRTNFKKEFGISPLMWLRQQKAEAVKRALEDRRNTLKDVIHQFDFSSHNQLYNFCIGTLHATPSEIQQKGKRIIEKSSETA